MNRASGTIEEDADVDGYDGDDDDKDDEEKNPDEWRWRMEIERRQRTVGEVIVNEILEGARGILSKKRCG